MRDRALRRHQEVKAKIKKQNEFNTCIMELPESERYAVESNIEKLKKKCVPGHSGHHTKKTAKKTVQEMKHDISMKEQLP